MASDHEATDLWEALEVSCKPVTSIHNNKTHELVATFKLAIVNQKNLKQKLSIFYNSEWQSLNLRIRILESETHKLMTKTSKLDSS